MVKGYSLESMRDYAVWTAKYHMDRTEWHMVKDKIGLAQDIQNLMNSMDSDE